MAKGTVAVAKEEMKKPAKLHSLLHPPYFQMICEAISSLKDRTGSSQQAISKFIEEKHSKTLPPNFKKILSIQLKKFVKSEKLVKVKNSFKISETEKVKIKEKLTTEASNLTVKKTTEKKKLTKEASNLTIKKTVAKTVSEKAKKTKRLSQVKTPEALKKKDTKKTTVVIEKTKKSSQDKSPAGLKKNLTPMKRKKGSNAVISSKPATKKARK